MVNAPVNNIRNIGCWHFAVIFFYDLTVRPPLVTVTDAADGEEVEKKASLSGKMAKQFQKKMKKIGKMATKTEKAFQTMGKDLTDGMKNLKGQIKNKESASDSTSEQKSRRSLTSSSLGYASIFFLIFCR